jgi:hypothetical protein
LPAVPSFAELGYRNFEPLIWQGFFVPLGTPPEIVEKLGRAIHDGLRRPEVAQKIRDWGFEPVGSLPAEFQARLREEDAIWAAVAAATGAGGAHGRRAAGAERLAGEQQPGGLLWAELFPVFRFFRKKTF